MEFEINSASNQVAFYRFQHGPDHCCGGKFRDVGRWLLEMDQPLDTSETVCKFLRVFHYLLQDRLVLCLAPVFDQSNFESPLEHRQGLGDVVQLARHSRCDGGVRLATRFRFVSMK